MGADFTSFSLMDSDGETYSAFLIRDSVIHIKVPNTSQLDNLIARYEVNGEEVNVVSKTDTEGKPDFSDFHAPVRYKVISQFGETKEWKVLLYDLPVLILNTPDSLPITSKEVRTEGCELTLINEDGNIQSLGTAGVRGRGNSTWDQTKKPYNIKFDNKVGILGMKASKHWILLANPHYDRTQLHNATAFYLASLTDYPWVQSGRFVELILNGEHKGLYYLCEKIRVEKGKISLDDTDYLLESFVVGENINAMVLPDYCFTTDYFNVTGPYWARRTIGWEIKHPDDYNDEQFTSIAANLNEIESDLSNDETVLDGTYREHFDIGSAADWWLVQEATVNMEASKSKNVFIYKTKDGKLRMGPPWDFDAYSFGQYGVRCFLCKEDAMYYKQLFKDPVFVDCVKEKWNRYKTNWQKEIPMYIDRQYDYIHRAAERNEVMWPDWLELNKYPDVSYKQLVEDMKSFFITQTDWMDEQISQMNN